jgi:hypothetical protein
MTADSVRGQTDGHRDAENSSLIRVYESFGAWAGSKRELSRALGVLTW